MLHTDGNIFVDKVLLTSYVILIPIDIAIYLVDCFLDLRSLVKRICFVLLGFEDGVDVDSEFFNSVTVFSRARVH